MITKKIYKKKNIYIGIAIFIIVGGGLFLGLYFGFLKKKLSNYTRNKTKKQPKKKLSNYTLNKTTKQSKKQSKKQPKKKSIKPTIPVSIDNLVLTSASPAQAQAYDSVRNMLIKKIKKIENFEELYEIYKRTYLNNKKDFLFKEEYNLRTDYYSNDYFSNINIYTYINSLDDKKIIVTIKDLKTNKEYENIEIENIWWNSSVGGGSKKILFFDDKKKVIFLPTETKLYSELQFYSFLKTNQIASEIINKNLPSNKKFVYSYENYNECEVILDNRKKIICFMTDNFENYIKKYGMFIIDHKNDKDTHWVRGGWTIEKINPILWRDSEVYNKENSPKLKKFINFFLDDILYFLKYGFILKYKNVDSINFSIIIKDDLKKEEFKKNFIKDIYINKTFKFDPENGDEFHFFFFDLYETELLMIKNINDGIEYNFYNPLAIDYIKFKKKTIRAFESKIDLYDSIIKNKFVEIFKFLFLRYSNYLYILFKIEVKSKNYKNILKEEIIKRDEFKTFKDEFYKIIEDYSNSDWYGI